MQAEIEETAADVDDLTLTDDDFFLEAWQYSKAN
jgi:hypothetical protein